MWFIDTVFTAIYIVMDMVFTVIYVVHTSAKSQKTCELFELFGAFLPVTQAGKHPQAQQE
jgi:preprotein translocase subunit SecY